VELIGLKHGGLTNNSISNVVNVVALLKYILKLQITKMFF